MYDTISYLITVACLIAGIAIGLRKFRESQRPTWARWALLLPTMVIFALGLMLLHNWSTRPLLAHMQKEHHEKRVDRLMDATRLYAVLRDVEPGTHARLHAPSSWRAKGMTPTSREPSCRLLIFTRVCLRSTAGTPTTRP